MFAVNTHSLGPCDLVDDGVGIDWYNICSVEFFSILFLSTIILQFYVSANNVRH